MLPVRMDVLVKGNSVHVGGGLRAWVDAHRRVGELHRRRWSLVMVGGVHGGVTWLRG